MMIELTAREYEIACEVGIRRYRAAREMGAVNRKMSRTDSQYEVETNGMAAEMAFCKLIGVRPDFSDTPQVADCEWMGYQIDVKATKQPNGRLLLETDKRKLCDLYVLMCGERDVWRCGGVAHVNVIRQPENLKVLKEGYKPTYALAQSRLIPIDQLLQLAKGAKCLANSGS